jgi:D-aminopeptidase
VQHALAGLQGGASKPYSFSAPFTLELTFTRTSKADMAELVPGARRVGARALQFCDADFLTVFKAFRAMTALGSLA